MPLPAEPKKKPKWHKEEIKDDGSSDSYITGGFLPILRPTAVVASSIDMYNNDVGKRFMK